MGGARTPQGTQTVSPIVLSRRIPELDGLRGIAIGMVLISHCFTSAIAEVWPNPLSYMRYATRLTWTGVDLFFVLSGFLIGGILLDARDSPRYFQVFYFRRACRILPAYFAYLLALVVCYHYYFPHHRGDLDVVFQPTLPWYSYVTLLQNFWMSARNSLGAPVLAITWSLAVEEQFYLTLPAIIRAVPLRRLPHILLGGILFAPAFRTALLLRWPILAKAAVFTLLPSRMDSLLFGVLIAFLLRRKAIWDFTVARGRWLWALLAVLALGLPVLNSVPIPNSFLEATVGYDWFALLYSTLLVLALTQPKTLLGWALRNSWLRGLGGVAYMTYLIHTVVFEIFMATVRHHGNIHWSVADVTASFGGMALSVAIAKVSWAVFEKRIVRWGHQYSY